MHRVTTHTPAFISNPTTDGKLVEFMLYSQKNGFSDATANTRYKILTFKAKNNVNLADPEAVKPFIAKRKEWSDGHKRQDQSVKRTSKTTVLRHRKQNGI